MTTAVPKIRDDGGVKWLLSGLLLRRLVSIAKSLLANELDLRDWMSPSEPPSYRGSDGTRDEAWFDFIADTGDDPYVMERLAIASNTGYAAGALSPEPHPDLPRGEFLILGGDTAYVTPDEETLRYRFVEPFQAAYIACGSPAVRPVYAIPGNHDYYDGLVGFNRMFRAPLSVAESRCALPVAGHIAVQEASYLKILLPGTWELWAVDVGHHGLDYRQRNYFRPSGARPPDKLIICTHAPPIASDRYALSASDRAAYHKLLEPERPAFLPDHNHRDTDKCRLFLAGHVHHYARYDGQRDGKREPTRCASVVAGAGGSFVHPTEHQRGRIRAAVKYPEPERSRRLTATAVTAPWQIINGGYIWVVGAILAILFHLTWPGPTTDLRCSIIWTVTVFLCFGVIGGGVSLLSFIVNRRVRAAKQSRPLPGEPTMSRPKPHPNGRRLSSAIVPISIAIALVLPFVASAIEPGVNPLSAPAVWLTLGAAVVVGMGAVGAISAGPPHRILFALMGAVHGAVQVAIPHALACRGWGALGATLVAWLGLAWIGRVLYRGRHRMLTTLWWLVQGVGIAGVLWFAPWPPARTAGLDLWLLVIIAGALTSAVQFGHYLLAVSAWDGHCNEVGITARSKSYKQWIRFHVTRDRLTGYVIGLDEPDAAPRLVDVFTIG